MKLSHRLFIPVVCTAFLACSKPAPAPSPVAINSALDVVTAMHDRYASSWFDNLTFTQRTIRRLRSGKDTTETWTETIGSPSHLRIDIGGAPGKRGALFTADSTYIIEDGRLSRAVPGGNPLLTLLHAVYKQPVSATLEQLAPLHIDMRKFARATWEERPVWIVGATDAADAESGQFWVDAERLVVVRLLQPRPGGTPIDVHMDNYQPVGGGWIALHVVALDNRVPVQTEDYTSLRPNRTLDPRLFDPAHWMDAKRP